MISQEVRRGFLRFFKEHGHSIVPSSSVVPHEDPTLLFTNAGMNQFKDVFLGKAIRDYETAATSQKCIRVGGKHNDLDNVGHTTRHLTFFEMLGNFSFGNYFKPQAIEYAWKLSTEIFQIQDDKIWVTVFEEDDEAFELWKKFVPERRIVRMGEKDNFWAMGDTGPCGPCSELLFDRGNSYGSGTSPLEDPAGERFFEFWNLVFMQYNRDEQGTFSPLPKQSIDTGAGLERVVSLKMNVGNVFQTDIFRSLIAQIENVFQISYNHSNASAFHVIADHIRSLSFACADGAQPSNVDRGYVLRKILRRAVRYARGLGIQQPFLAKILPRLIEIMGEDYPELSTSKHRIGEILTLEEESFFKTLKRGGNLLSQIIDESKQDPLKQISGEKAFKLKDTYGLPLEEILLIAKDTGLEVNLESYQLLENQAKEKSKAAHASVHQISEENIFEDFAKNHGTCLFTGYTEFSSKSSIIAIFFEGKFVDLLPEGKEAMIFLETTPFYPEKGGQVADTGEILHKNALFEVTHCHAPYPGVIAHTGILKKGTLLVGEPVEASIDHKRRSLIAHNHTAVHLLQYALTKVLGDHIKQAGSLVDSQRLRFDFSHHKPVSKEELRLIEQLVNEKIREGKTINTYELSYEQASSMNEIKQFFGDKYGAQVRVVDIDYSKELCGGTHASSTNEIGLFKIIKESSIAAGIRRIEAVTGEVVQNLLYNHEALLDRCSSKLKTSPHLLEEKIDLLLEENRSLLSQIKTLKKESLHFLAKQYLESAEQLGTTSIIIHQIPCQKEDLPLFAEQFQTGSFFLAIAVAEEGSCHIVIKISPDLEKKGLHAGNLIKQILPLIEGNGGGKADIAQAGGKRPLGILEAFQTLSSSIKGHL